MDLQATSAFGRHLKLWRSRRGWSQLELSTRSNVSQRHISFIETGRSRPKEEVVEKLAAALDISLRDRNLLLEAAGLAPLYPELPLSAVQLSPFRAAISRLLQTHEPFPAFVLDRWWQVVDGNRAARRMFPALDAGPVSFCELFFGPGPLRALVVNYRGVAHAVLKRLRADVASAGPDERLEALLARSEQLLADVPEPELPEASSELVLCPHLQLGDRVIKTLSMVARFGHTREVTLDELRVELMLPQDAEAEAFFQAAAASPAEPALDRGAHRG